MKRKLTKEEDRRRKQQARANLSPNSKGARNHERRVQRLMHARKISREVAEFIIAKK